MADKKQPRKLKYTVQGNQIIRGRTCPKCGPAVFMAEHKDRYYCGRCHYTEFKKN